LSLCNGQEQIRFLTTFATDFDEDGVQGQPIPDFEEGLLLVLGYIGIKDGLMAHFTKCAACVDLV
jgi:hypothetical protein